MTNDLSITINQSDNANRLEKGFRFETEICHIIEQSINYDYFEHNPIDYNEWLHNVGEGCDVTLVVKGLAFNIECKYLDTNRVYPSYVWRDYIPRFKAKSSYCVIVTNNKWNIPYNCRKLLQEHNIVVWSSYELTYNIITLTNGYLKRLKKDTDKIEFIIETGEGDDNEVTENVFLSQKTKTELPSKSKKSRESIDHNRPMKKSRSHRKSENMVVFLDLFRKGLESIHSIPFERKTLMSYVRKRLMYILCLLLNEERFKVKTMGSELDTWTFLQKYTRNIFECAHTLAEAMERGSISMSNMPSVLYHGTTTELLPEILEKGLLPYKAGQCWDKDKEKRVWLTDSMYGAEFFALRAMERFGGQPVILALHTGKLKDKLTSLGRETFEEEHPSVFDSYRQFFSEKPVEPKQIKHYYILPKEQSPFLAIETMKSHYVKNQ